MKQLVESHAKRHRTQIEFERERDRAFLEFRRKKAENHRNHELEMARVFAAVLFSSWQAHQAVQIQVYPVPHVYQNTTQISTSIQPSLTGPSISTAPVFRRTMPLPHGRFNFNSSSFPFHQNWENQKWKKKQTKKNKKNPKVSSKICFFF